MKKQDGKALSLHAETLRALTSPAIGRVAAGTTGTTACGGPCHTDLCTPATCVSQCIDVTCFSCPC